MNTRRHAPAPARRAAACRPACILAALTLLGAAAARADLQIDEALDAAADGRVEISNVAGSVDVIGVDGTRIDVTGSLDEDAHELIFERDGDLVTIKVEIDRSARNVDDSRLVIRLPKASRVEIDTVSADVTVRDTDGTLRISTVSGDIEVATAAAELDMTTMSGDVQLHGAGQEAAAVLSTVSGRVSVRDIGGTLQSSSVSGNVEVHLGAMRSVQAKSTSGDVVVHATLLPDARVQMESVSGDTRLQLASSTDGRYDLSSFSGDVEACFGPKPESRRMMPGARLQFTQGDGGPSVRASTMSGDIVICDD